MKENTKTEYNVITPPDKTRLISWVIDSLNNLTRYQIRTDSKAVDLCIDMLQEYADRLDPQKDQTPVYPPEIEAVITLLHKVSYDLSAARDVVTDNVKVLNQAIEEKPN